MAWNDETKRYLVSVLGVIFMAGIAYNQLSGVGESLKSIQISIEKINEVQTTQIIDMKLLQARVLTLEQQHEVHNPQVSHH